MFVKKKPIEEKVEIIRKLALAGYKKNKCDVCLEILNVISSFVNEKNEIKSDFLLSNSQLGEILDNISLVLDEKGGKLSQQIKNTPVDISSITGNKK